MNDDEINKKKKELMKPDWTENLHHALKELDNDDSKKIVELMTDAEIYSKVNNRKFQEDYIADYLEYLWEISESAYWKHIISSLDVHVGILWGDHMSHFEKLCQNELTDEVFNAVMNFVVNCDKRNIQDIEAIGCVIRAQAERYERLNDMRLYLSDLDGSIEIEINELINQMLVSYCTYRFY